MRAPVRRTFYEDSSRSHDLFSCVLSSAPATSAKVSKGVRLVLDVAALPKGILAAAVFCASRTQNWEDHQHQQQYQREDQHS